MARDVKTISRTAAIHLIQMSEARMETRNGQEVLVVKGYDIEKDAESERLMHVVDDPNPEYDAWVSKIASTGTVE